MREQEVILLKRGSNSHTSKDVRRDQNEEERFCVNRTANNCSHVLCTVLRGEEGWIKDKMNYEVNLRQGSMRGGAATVGKARTARQDRYERGGQHQNCGTLPATLIQSDPRITRGKGRKRKMVASRFPSRPPAIIGRRLNRLPRAAGISSSAGAAVLRMRQLTSICQRRILDPLTPSRVIPVCANSQSELTPLGIWV